METKQVMSSRLWLYCSSRNHPRLRRKAETWKGTFWHMFNRRKACMWGKKHKDKYTGHLFYPQCHQYRFLVPSPAPDSGCLETRCEL